MPPALAQLQLAILVLGVLAGAYLLRIELAWLKASTDRGSIPPAIGDAVVRMFVLLALVLGALLLVGCGS